MRPLTQYGLMAENMSMVSEEAEKEFRSIQDTLDDCFYRMRDDQHRFLSLLGQFPARLTAEQAAWVINCQVHNVPILVAPRLLKPLGNPPSNGIKFFCTYDVLEHSKDRAWLVKVTTAINGHWHKQNARKKSAVSKTGNGFPVALITGCW